MNNNLSLTRYGSSFPASVPALGIVCALVSTAGATPIFSLDFNLPPGVYAPGPMPGGLANNGPADVQIQPNSLFTNPNALPVNGNSTVRILGYGPTTLVSTALAPQTLPTSGLWGSFLVQTFSVSPVIGLGNTGIRLNVETVSGPGTIEIANRSNVVAAIRYIDSAGGITASFDPIYPDASFSYLNVFNIQNSGDRSQITLTSNPQSDPELYLAEASLNIPRILSIQSLQIELSAAALGNLILADSRTDVMIPTPTAASVLALGGLLAARRRR